ncbi:unnamed protein product [Didymodactylos carnosus]|uniref:Uncharacterized protein n=1 Tax=Didymodactylos carnosus TaxID=1234261 RepID=A0A8S2QWY3_9BILA|nr:unnamed protein product [Didymodactylos carnosus]CAF4126848.1 unnamed protein product [Didymodactylos carnosus]
MTIVPGSVETYPDRDTTFFLYPDQDIGGVPLLPGEYESLKDRFRQILGELETFTDPDKCLRFIRQCSNRTIFLIASGTLGEIIVPKVYNYPQIHAIFILCVNIAKHKTWATKFSDKTNIFDFDEDLLIRLINEIARYFTNEAEKLRDTNQLVNAYALYSNAQLLFDKANVLQRKACDDVLSLIEIQKAKLEQVKGENNLETAQFSPDFWSLSKKHTLPRDSAWSITIHLEHLQYTLTKQSYDAEIESSRLMKRLEMCEFFIEPFTIVCLNTSSTYQRIHVGNKAFKSGVYNTNIIQPSTVACCTDKDQCFEFIKLNAHKTISLIILLNTIISEDWKPTVEQYSHLSQIHWIYVLSTKVPQDKALLINYSKVRGIYDAENILFCQFLNDAATYFISRGDQVKETSNENSSIKVNYGVAMKIYKLMEDDFEQQMKNKSKLHETEKKCH